jgi:hypothetical protein
LPCGTDRTLGATEGCDDGEARKTRSEVRNEALESAGTVFPWGLGVVENEERRGTREVRDDALFEIGSLDRGSEFKLERHSEGIEQQTATGSGDAVDEVSSVSEVCGDARVA